MLTVGCRAFIVCVLDGFQVEFKSTSLGFMCFNEDCQQAQDHQGVDPTDLQ